ncbi:MAG: lipase maturation factor family protein [Chthoniobacterales bacterium]|nr:lipase maturation factor family protein [Chthoniobacterales bacterium]
MDGEKAPPRPVLFWDADCGFCRRWVDRWREITGDAVEYRTLQDAPQNVAARAGGAPFQHIVVQQSDGSMVTGARAAITALATTCPSARWLRAACTKLPPLDWVAARAYRWVAAHRVLCGRLTNLFWGATTLAPTYGISGWLVPRLVGLVFLSAFLSLWVQIDGLAGSRGIQPVAGYLDAVGRHFAAGGQPWQAWLNIPSLLWFGANDRVLHGWLGIGTFASLLLALGRLPAASAFVAWLCYLAFATALPVFLNFQWDSLLLEAGLLVVLYVPWRGSLRWGKSTPTRIGRLLVWWLLFRLMFESGVVKLFGFDAGGRNTWLEGTALGYHYFTQPIPVWTSWWLGQLPAWFHLLSLAVVFFIELILPFFIAGPRRLRMTAFWGFAFLMALIMASGHYGFFNLLMLALAASLIDDASWPAWLRRSGTAAWEPVSTKITSLQRTILPWIAVVLVVLTTAQLLMVMRLVSPSSLGPLLSPFLPLRSANSYGLFSVMTTERPEITLEGSTDGIHWEPYRFRWKMDADRTSMPFLPPHMPRLDWQMWFAALEYRSSGNPPAWMMSLLSRLQEQSPGVLALLESAPESPPAYFRLRLDLLTFAPPEMHQSSGLYWRSQPLPEYTLEGALQPANP